MGENGFRRRRLCESVGVMLNGGGCTRAEPVLLHLSLHHPKGLLRSNSGASQSSFNRGRGSLVLLHEHLPAGSVCYRSTRAHLAVRVEASCCFLDDTSLPASATAPRPRMHPPYRPTSGLHLPRLATQAWKIALKPRAASSTTSPCQPLLPRPLLVCIFLAVQRVAFTILGTQAGKRLSCQEQVPDWQYPRHKTCPVLDLCRISRPCLFDPVLGGKLCAGQVEEGYANRSS